MQKGAELTLYQQPKKRHFQLAGAWLCNKSYVLLTQIQMKFELYKHTQIWGNYAARRGWIIYIWPASMWSIKIAGGVNNYMVEHTLQKQSHHHNLDIWKHFTSPQHYYLWPQTFQDNLQKLLYMKDNEDQNRKLVHTKMFWLFFKFSIIWKEKISVLL